MHRAKTVRFSAVAPVGVLALGLALTPLARAEVIYLAQAIGEPATIDIPARPRDTTPELPGLGTENPSPTASTEGGSTWKWVAGLALTVALLALAKGGGDSGGAPTSGGGGSGDDGPGNGGGGNNGGSNGGGLPTLPLLPGSP